MTRIQLEHIIRAAAANADTEEIVIMESQSILGSFADPGHEDLTTSMEADVFPLNAPERAILIDGAIGERSVFHETFGYYAHGVSPETATLPADWEKRLVLIQNENTRGFKGWCLEPHDLAVSKLAAGRPKDISFLKAMKHVGMLNPQMLLTRLAHTNIKPDSQMAALKAQVERICGEAVGEGYRL
jgi:hypothetical protein